MNRRKIRDYQVRGVETQVVWRATHGLTIQGAVSYNHSEQINSPYLSGDIAGTASYGQPLLQARIPFGPEGSPLAQ